MRWLAGALLLALLAAATGCKECKSTGDCKAGEVCRSGECKKAAATGGDADSDGDGDGDTGGGGSGDSDADSDTGGGDSDADAGGGAAGCGKRSCWMPPKNDCWGNPNATVYVSKYAASGYCEGGDCVYPTVVDRCSTNVCSNGACVGVHCEGAVCSLPPSAECADGDHLRVYNRVGRCRELATRYDCVYDSSLVDCPNGCASGRCTGEPCAGVTCDRPPARYCTDKGTLIAFLAPGVCEDGECRYGSREVTCTTGCENGSCAGAQCAEFACDLPPASYCVDEITLRSYSSEGACEDGFCRFGSNDTLCSTLCEEGQCLGEPCIGVRCDTPPAGYCRGDALVTFDSPGTCSDGACTYNSSETDCPGGCATGACL